MPVIGGINWLFDGVTRFGARDGQAVLATHGLKFRSCAVVVDMRLERNQLIVLPARLRAVAVSVGGEEQEIDLEFELAVHGQAFGITREGYPMEPDGGSVAQHVEKNFRAVTIHRIEGIR
jgi:hypothetical protein